MLVLCFNIIVNFSRLAQRPHQPRIFRPSTKTSSSRRHTTPASSKTLEISSVRCKKFFPSFYWLSSKMDIAFRSNRFDKCSNVRKIYRGFTINFDFRGFKIWVQHHKLLSTYLGICNRLVIIITPFCKFTFSSSN